MKKPIPFTILVPVVDMELDAESRHIGDITVQATCHQYPDGSLLMDDDEEGRPDVDITLMWGLKNVTTLLSTLAPDFVWECRLAAAEHAKQFDTYQAPEEGSREQEEQDFAEKVNDHFEQEIMER